MPNALSTDPESAGPPAGENSGLANAAAPSKAASRSASDALATTGSSS